MLFIQALVTTKSVNLFPWEFLVPPWACDVGNKSEFGTAVGF